MLVSLMSGKAEVKYDPAVLNAAAVTQLIQDVGFGAQLMEDDAVTRGELSLLVSGMTCASCVHNIQSKLTTTKGVLSASIALATKTAHIQFDPEVLGARDLIRIIQVFIECEHEAFINPVATSKSLRMFFGIFLVPRFSCNFNKAKRSADSGQSCYDFWYWCSFSF